MDQQRQNAFQKLRPVCVELSAVALRFRGNQAPVKDVLHALDAQHRMLETIGKQNQLDEKLSEYAFFPLTHVLKESQRLSPRCMEVAVQSIAILVSQGWKSKLAPAMGQQLLIFMSLLVGADPRKQSHPPSEELVYTAFKCIEQLIKWMGRSSDGKTFFQDQTAKNMVDQLAYLLVESLSEATSDEIQVAAAETLLELFANIPNRVFLASLLPRTVSSLTKALKPSTQARRTNRVLITNLRLLGMIIRQVLADAVTFREGQDKAEKEALDNSWLKASAGQIKNALTQVCKLRSQDRVDVRKALFDLCVMIIEDCSKTLADSISVLLETCVVLTGDTDDSKATPRLKAMITIHPELAEILQSSFYDWSQSLPRVMQGNDDRPKELLITKLTHVFALLTESTSSSDNLVGIIASTITKSINVATETNRSRSIQTYANEPNQYTALNRQDINKVHAFDPVLFNHQSEKASAKGLEELIISLQRNPSAGHITRRVVDSIATFSSDQKLAPMWLAVQLLQSRSQSTFEVEDMLDMGEVSSDQNTSYAYLVRDLYAQTKEILLESSPHDSVSSLDARLTALAVESLTLQANQLGPAYRDELYETLYPVLALLNSNNNMLQNHAIVALNLLANSCGYASVSNLLIENVDYLVNSIAWKLNVFNLSPEAPAVLNVITRLVGAKIIPYLDDLIDSIFSALDSFHGYTQWVEMLFEVLKTIVDESVKNPQMSIEESQVRLSHRRMSIRMSTIDDILGDLRARKKRKSNSDRTRIPTAGEAAPHRPWTKAEDDPNYKPDPTEGKDLETLLREAEIADEENDLPAPKEPEDDDTTKPLSKSHGLLLKIAQATVSHLSGPSARVRHILLQLLAQISPLLARHENTFLPLVNAIWPGVVQRLLADVTASTSSEDEAGLEGETAYNVVAAADVMTELCENAGDFMASRIEQIFPQLRNIYSKMWKEAEGQMNRSKRDTSSSRSGSVLDDIDGKKISGIVDLQVVKNQEDSSVARTKDNSLATLGSSSRASTGQVFTSLVRLFVSILNHVRLNEDNADAIFALLTPLDGRSGPTGKLVSDTLEMYNPDAVWVMRCRRVVEDETTKGVRTIDDRVWRAIPMPALNESLVKEGLTLQSVIF